MPVVRGESGKLISSSGDVQTGINGTDASTFTINENVLSTDDESAQVVLKSANGSVVKTGTCTLNKTTDRFELDKELYTPNITVDDLVHIDNRVSDPSAPAAGVTVYSKNSSLYFRASTGDPVDVGSGLQFLDPTQFAATTSANVTQGDALMWDPSDTNKVKPFTAGFSTNSAVTYRSSSGNSYKNRFIALSTTKATSVFYDSDGSSDAAIGACSMAISGAGAITAGTAVEVASSTNLYGNRHPNACKVGTDRVLAAYAINDATAGNRHGKCRVLSIGAEAGPSTTAGTEVTFNSAESQVESLEADAGVTGRFVLTYFHGGSSTIKAICGHKDTHATGTITVTGDPTADQTLTIAVASSLVYTAKASGATGRQFNISAGNNNQTATNICNAINANDSDKLYATVSSNVVTVRNLTGGTAGNDPTHSISGSMTNVSFGSFSGGQNDVPSFGTAVTITASADNVQRSCLAALSSGRLHIFFITGGDWMHSTILNVSGFDTVSVNGGIDEHLEKFPGVVNSSYFHGPVDCNAMIALDTNRSVVFLKGHSANSLWAIELDSSYLDTTWSATMTAQKLPQRLSSMAYRNVRVAKIDGSHILVLADNYFTGNTSLAASPETGEIAFIVSRRGGVYELGSMVDLNSLHGDTAFGPSVGAAALYDTNKLILGLEQGGNYKARTITVTSPQVFAGIAESTVSSGQSVNAYRPGTLAPVFTGLSPGASYMAKFNGALSTELNHRTVGVAVSATTLYIAPNVVTIGTGTL